MAEIQKMEEWKAKQAAKDKLNNPQTNVKPITASALSSLQKAKVEDSYTSDSFEDVSVSGSGSKTMSMSSKSGVSVSNSGALGNIAVAEKGLKMSKIEESSDVGYEDDDFESLSRSQQ